MKNKIKIGIVDDHKPTLRNLIQLLDYSKEVEVVISANSGKAFIQKLSDLEQNELPQVVLTDVDMPEMSGIDMVLIAKGRFPSIHFLMLTVYDDEDLLFQAIKAGAEGYLLKDEKIGVIIQHIQNILENGGVPMSPSIALKTLNLIKKSNRDSAPIVPDNVPVLSQRELEVLQLLVDGSDYKKIASALFISSNTVKKHISSIYSKLHVSSKAEAIKMSHHYGLL